MTQTQLVMYSLLGKYLRKLHSKSEQIHLMNVLTEKMATGNCYKTELEFLYAETDIECSELNEGEF